MGIIINRDAEKNIIIAKLPDTPSLTNLNIFLTELQAELATQEKNSILTDARALNATPSIDLLKQLSRQMKEHHAAIEKSAVLVSPGIMMNIVQTVIIASGRNDIRIFQVEKEALDWLVDPGMLSDDDIAFEALASVMRQSEQEKNKPAPLPPLEAWGSKPAEAAVPEKKSEVSAPVKTDGEITILIAEDNLAIQAIYKKILQKDFPEFKILTADNGAKAWKIISSTSVDLLVTDIMMPEVFGIDLIKQVRAERRFAKLPIIVVTTLGDKSSVLVAMQSGASDYMVKPVSSKLMADRIAAFLKIKR